MQYKKELFVHIQILNILEIFDSLVVKFAYAKDHTTVGCRLKSSIIIMIET